MLLPARVERSFVLARSTPPCARCPMSPAHRQDIINEKRGHASCSTVLYRARHPPILPANYKTFEEYLPAVEEV